MHVFWPLAAAEYGCNSVANEARLLPLCDHPNVIKCYGANLVPPTPFLVLEYMPYSLHALIKDDQHPLPLEKAST